MNALWCSSEVLLRLGDTTCFNRRPLMQLNCSTNLYTRGLSPVFCHESWQSNIYSYVVLNVTVTLSLNVIFMNVYDGVSGSRSIWHGQISSRFQIITVYCMCYNKAGLVNNLTMQHTTTDIVKGLIDRALHVCNASVQTCLHHSCNHLPQKTISDAKLWNLNATIDMSLGCDTFVGPCHILMTCR